MRKLSLSGYIIYLRLLAMKGLNAIRHGLNCFISMIISVASRCGFQPSVHDHGHRVKNTWLNNLIGPYPFSPLSYLAGKHQDVICSYLMRTTDGSDVRSSCKTLLRLSIPRRPPIIQSKTSAQAKRPAVFPIST